MQSPNGINKQANKQTNKRSADQDAAPKRKSKNSHYARARRTAKTPASLLLEEANLVESDESHASKASAILHVLELSLHVSQFINKLRHEALCRCWE